MPGKQEEKHRRRFIERRHRIRANTRYSLQYRFLRASSFSSFSYFPFPLVRPYFLPFIAFGYYVILKQFIAITGNNGNLKASGTKVQLIIYSRVWNIINKWFGGDDKSNCYGKLS
jgi:hypothetical protein